MGDACSPILFHWVDWDSVRKHCSPPRNVAAQKGRDALWVRTGKGVP